jgi:nitric oxide reductase activation protein
MRAAPPPPGRTSPEPIDDHAPRHPEWDRLIARLRPAWCRVVEEAAASPDDDVPPAAMTAPRPAWRRMLLGPRASGPWQASHDGPQLDLDALLRLHVSQRGGREGDDRIHRTRSRRQRIGSALLLIDQSASTAAPWKGSDASQLQAARTLAWQAAQALRGAGLVTAIAAFSSNGRHAVSWRQVQRFGEPLCAPCHARLAGLHSGGSTRLGTAIRHGTRALARRPDGERVLLVISDGQPHDIDVHDPRYLVEDARHAVRSARRQGLTVRCLSLDPGSVAARRIFGAADLR